MIGVIGASGVYSLGAAPVGGLTPAGSFNIDSDYTPITRVHIKDNGLTLVLLSVNSTEYPYTMSRFSMSSALDISTLTDDINQFVFPSGIQAFHMSADGTRAYAGTFQRTVYSYILSTAYDLTTATLDETEDYDGEGTGMRDVLLSPDGTTLYHLSADRTIYVYSLTVAYETGSYTYTPLKNFTLPDVSASYYQFQFSPDGLIMCAVTSSGGVSTFHKFTLTVAFDLTTATFDSNYVVGGSRSFNGFWMSNDGKTFIGISANDSQLYKYTTNIAFDI
ncbi:hypothetical protein Molly5_60 [Maribacter phage Molly_5]|uniref:Uncharacterized protein n=1 Tax=Maribacter phage Molly_1 TaxID=2745685 RepID=A0A8E4XZU6_9CAUD|nr:hypothetical protein M1M29_gp060 [Maribacter phage Molly_1]QQO97745.1 hypothetical protein Molly2_60 [Maribacter phage Molly_2]QQO97945.1 hypothetical protein Molly3_60 [Maribacter phage Molly_3]QQO98145.1 hypothetical protein Molly4_60 [Maribacter phage Molly_4]QQO98345.1 hypothetical protein Molly5_60 [Maribacter phage Molly_5]QQO97545.1 hypothetical protein Molly1_60 [Maribacter phage Molly_1]